MQEPKFKVGDIFVRINGRVINILTVTRTSLRHQPEYKIYHNIFGINFYLEDELDDLITRGKYKKTIKYCAIWNNLNL
jgi:hypothetical protein